MPNAPATLEAELTYTVNDGQPIINETFADGNIARKVTGNYEPHRVTLTDGRTVPGGFDIEKNGFVFVPHPTRVSDFFDKAQLESVYYPEVIELVKAQSGAKRVVVFDHTLRSGNEDERKQRLIREPVLTVHNDYTDWSGPNRLKELMPDEADELLKRRFAIIQVWRPIAAPVLSNPLAMADARSLAPEDLIISERRFPDRIGQTYRVSWNPAHRWHYFSAMRRDEALVFKVYDSEKDGRARFTPHTSFTDPTTPHGAPPRQSIEVRTLAFF